MYIVWKKIWTLIKKNNSLTNLYHKHGLLFKWNLDPLMETKIILTKKNYFSMFIFTFKKRNIDSFFSLY